MHLSPDQELAVEYVQKWMQNAGYPEYTADARGNNITVGTSHDYAVCSVGGYAGTGKTTVLQRLAETYPSAVLVTPTHKAAQVLRRKLAGPGAVRVRTFHSLIYTPESTFRCCTSGNEMEPGPEEGQLLPCNYHVKYHDAEDDRLCDPQEELKFLKLPYLRGRHDLVIVEEAGMLTEREVNDLRSYGLPVLLTGDHGQLPPVKAKMNPWIEHPSVTLTVNHRQGEDSGIPEAADEARVHGVLYGNSYGSSVRVLEAGSEECRNLLDRFRPDAKEATFLVQFNKTRAALNRYFRQQYGYSEILEPGDRLIALERQEDVQVVDSYGDVTGETLLFNGMLATVKEQLKETERTVTVIAELDADILGNAGTRVLLRIAKEQLGRPDGLPYRLKPPGSSLWDYAYALTAHKAQGSEFDNVIVWNEQPGDKRWLYTACTRARRGLVVLQALH